MPERTWILTGSPENYAATRELGFTLIGMKSGGAAWRSRCCPATGSCSTWVAESDARVLMEAMGERARTPA